MMDTYTFRSPYSKFMLGSTIVGMVLMHGAFMACMGGMARSGVGTGRFYTYLLVCLWCSMRFAYRYVKLRSTM